VITLKYKNAIFIKQDGKTMFRFFVEGSGNTYDLYDSDGNFISQHTEDLSLLPVTPAQEEDYNVLGDFHYNSKDFNTAVLYYSKGIAEKNEYAFKKLADIFFKKVYPLSIHLTYNGKTVSKVPLEIDTSDDFDPNNFIEMFKSMAKNGHELAEYLLACCYETGYGVNKNETLAINMFNKIMTVYNNPVCMRKVAHNIYNSDIKKAIGLMEKAIKIKPSPSAYLEQAIMYYERRNYGKAKKCAQKSVALCKSRSGYSVFAACSGRSSMSINQFDEAVYYANLANRKDDSLLEIMETKYIRSILKF
jgi:tetratricopeptide (TPR) repeat protein